MVFAKIYCSVFWRCRRCHDVLSDPQDQIAYTEHAHTCAGTFSRRDAIHLTFGRASDWDDAAWFEYMLNYGPTTCEVWYPDDWFYRDYDCKKGGDDEHECAASGRGVPATSGYHGSARGPPHVRGEGGGGGDVRRDHEVRIGRDATSIGHSAQVLDLDSLQGSGALESESRADT